MIFNLDFDSAFMILSKERPEIRIVYTCMDAKNTVQLAVSIQPDFAQVALTLLDHQGQVQKEPYFLHKFYSDKIKAIILYLELRPRAE